MTMRFLDSGGIADADPGKARRRRAFWSSTGLIYLLPVTIDIAGYSGARMALAIAGLIAFAALFLATPLSLRSWLEPVRTRTYVLLAAFAVLSAALPFAFGPAWLGTSIYLSMVFAMTLPMNRVLWGVGGSMALAAVQCPLLGVPGALWPIALTTLSLGLFMVAFRHARTLVQQLRIARGEVARLAAADERLRIARDLHDLLGHSLSLIVLKAELARRLGERDAARAMAEVTDIESVARRSLADVRAAISGYRQRDLTEELDGARAVLSAAEVEVAVRTSGAPLPDQVDGLFGWAVREGVTNIVRHARARRVTITVARERGEATLEIVDDGRGEVSEGHLPGHGLEGLAERVADAAGTVAAGPREGGGFRLAVRVPLAPAGAERPAVESAM
ncbi:sensor histidine kinase [Actinomadura verrucosospora]|uniref:Two-component system sensor kinase n=1 Tax=Actinomadura verrucosospora TaxID=46165 RepID=A0A7D3ZMM5_ACTVE|nr:sensor histidine kinase [Actinomadura verrucosospora]QKG24021.1 two-component system sensor kinase [Actinomadura verrucosospora]